MNNTHLKPFTGADKEDFKNFELLYEKYYSFLCIMAEHIVKNKLDAEEVVSDVFMKLWKLRLKVDYSISIKSYLCKAVRNTSLNYIEKHKSKKNLTDYLANLNHEALVWNKDYQMGQLFEEDLIETINNGIDSLPSGCRQIFLMSRDKEMKYSEIAESLSISVNTVKTQMKIALMRLRDLLKDHLNDDS